MTATPDPAAGAGVERPPECVSHHHACDCREWRINELVRDLQEQLRQVKDDAYLSADDAVEWRARAERWRNATGVYRQVARAMYRTRMRTPAGYPTWRWFLRWFEHDSATVPRRLTTHQAPDGAG